MRKTIEASVYDHMRLGLKRLGTPLRVAVPGHRGLEVILDDRIWLCVDATAEDQPVMAWQDFASQGRSDLQTPVSCTLELYHRFAGLVMGSVLDSLNEALNERLKNKSQ
ncbi:MAG: hypothetical protein HY272_00075 [Gammaproteobacteria bacterium]|nr:hypothetical protein [Gammaproteobacteria bacterium]